MKPIQVYLPEAFIKQLKQKALDDGASVSDLIRDALGADNDVLLTNRIVVPKVKSLNHEIMKKKPDVQSVQTSEKPLGKLLAEKGADPSLAGTLPVKKTPEPFKFPPSAASQLNVIKTPEQAKKAVESPQFISKKYSSRKQGSKERHVDL